MKRIVFAMVLVCLLQFATAAVLSEKTLSDSGYNDFIVQGVDTNACTQIAFAKDLSQNFAGDYTVFSLHAQFLPVLSEDAKAIVFLNNDSNALETIKATDFENNWYRLILPREKLLEKNSLLVCLKTSNTVVEARLLSDSIIGTYKMPEFKAENFVKSVSNSNPIIGEEFEVTITITNTGSEATDVNVLNKKLEIDNERVQILRGQTSYFNIIKPDETVAIHYFVKAKQATVMSLQGAVAYYTNVFGERKRIVSNYPSLNVTEPEIKVKALFFLKEAVKKTGEQTSAQIAVKNEGRNTLYNISMNLQLPQGIILVNGNAIENIKSLKPKETRFFDLNLSSGTAKEYELGCKLVYLDYNVTETNCETANLSFEERTIPAELIFAIILVACSIAVYAFLQTRK